MQSISPLLIARLKARDLFHGRVYPAANLAALMRAGPSAQPLLQAHVLPSSLTGGRSEAASSAFIQAVDRGVSVVFSLPIGDATGAAQADDLEQLILATTEAVTGWGPEDCPGVFRLARGQLVSMQGGLIVYQLDFTIQDQLRHTP
ncbi:phage tail terminator protein [Tabrizicola fusiformis]|uniref:phage tail terminator protein n=1 Tax=Tabrizicola sp. SY72 TaxID=2741673 RepID=UPI00157259FB|nr:hypothetical protein [Tabrizicola sp. SY72]NTT88502.1 hypothetical protein [Tabrizicola sp. SY72]